MASKQTRPSAKRVKQHGGTFLGVVLGLIVGLAIAVVVALYITRSPTPFVSRSPTPASDAAASATGNVDPNRPLAGTSPGQAVPQSAQPTPPNTAPGQPSNPSTGLLDEPQIVEVPPASSAHAAVPDASTGEWPGTQQAAAPSAAAPAAASHPKPGAAPTPAPTAASANDTVNTGYFLQAGAYRTQADADQQRANLALLGFSAAVTRRDSGAVTFFRVRIGPFSKFDDMNAARQNLSGKGIDTAVIRFSRQQ